MDDFFEFFAGGPEIFSQFSPRDVSNLILWLDASAITGLNNNDPVATWSDRSGNGNDATQATATNRPLYKTNIVNGKPVVRFDGVDNYLTFGDLAALDFGTGGFSLYIVIQSTYTW